SANNGVLTVNGATTTTAAALFPTYNSADQSVTLSATVTTPVGGPVNAGTVTFGVFNGATQIGSSVQGTVTNGSASAGFTLPAGTNAGSYSIQANYGGSGFFLASSDNTHTLTLQKAPVTVASSNV